MNKFVKNLYAEHQTADPHKTDIQSNLRWNPKAAQFCYVCDNSIFIYDIDSEKTCRKTKKRTDTLFALVWSGNGKTIAYNRK